MCGLNASNAVSGSPLSQTPFFFFFFGTLTWRECLGLGDWAEVDNGRCDLVLHGHLLAPKVTH